MSSMGPLENYSEEELSAALERKRKQRVEEEVGRYVAELKGRVRGNVGDVVAIFRSIVIAEPRIDPGVNYIIEPRPMTTSYLEIGVVSGELVDSRENGEIKTVGDISEYYHSGGFNIPVVRKIGGQFLRVGPSLLDKLEDKGEISFGLEETEQFRRGRFTAPYVDKFVLLFGETDVGKILGKADFDGMDKGAFVRLLKSDEWNSFVDGYRNGREVR